MFLLLPAIFSNDLQLSKMKEDISAKYEKIFSTNNNNNNTNFSPKFKPQQQQQDLQQQEFENSSAMLISWWIKRQREQQNLCSFATETQDQVVERDRHIYDHLVSTLKQQQNQNQQEIVLEEQNNNNNFIRPTGTAKLEGASSLNGNIARVLFFNGLMTTTSSDHHQNNNIQVKNAPGLVGMVKPPSNMLIPQQQQPKSPTSSATAFASFLSLQH
jgi:hypothetical protein